MSAAPPQGPDLAGAPIVLPAGAAPTLAYAAAELARFLYLLTGKTSATVAAVPRRAPAVVLDPGAVDLAEQACRLAVKGRVLTIAGSTPVGVLYGVYELLGRLGIGFYAGGETYPERPVDAVLPADFAVEVAPVFKVRGNMLHYNFLCGTTNWGLDDYKFYFDQLARMRGNMLLMHWYDEEPGAACEVDGEYVTGGRTPSSLSRPWGALAALRTSEYSFGSGDFFDAEIWSSPMGEDLPHPIEEIKRSEAVFSEATRYARVAGIQVAAGFEMPPGDPTDTHVRRHFRERLSQFLESNPYLTHLAIWQREGGACSGHALPPAGSKAWELYQKKRGLFAYLGHESRIWEAIRTAEFARQAADWLAGEAPGMPMVLVGWGGDRWMRFANLCLAFDKVLPANVIFTCHENIDASWGPNVSTPWGQLPPERERWAMPWVEGDIDECWVRQPNVESLGMLAPDALAKGCQGLLTLQWRTRDVEEETGYVTRFAWDPGLTPDRFYHDLARHAFGADHEQDMGKVVGDLQKLGARWTGVRGTVECGLMRWTGHEPHFPFDLDGKAVAFLAELAAAAADALAIVPENPKDPASAAYHLRGVNDMSGRPRDPDRCGVADLTAATERLRELTATDDEAVLRRELKAVIEPLWDARAELVRVGMTTYAIRALDGFLIALHHVQRNAGASRKIPRLKRIRKQLATLRGNYGDQDRLERLERLDYLDATIDFVLHYDAVAMLLADGEVVDQAVEAATAKMLAGDVAAAARLAAAAYDKVVAAGMQDAVRALTRKVTTRCDWGVLTTFNVKAMPLYWQDLARLEDFMPVPPPRLVQTRGREHEAWLAWEPRAGATGQVLYRRRPGSSRWRAVCRHPLAGTCRMFIDRPQQGGAWEYAVASLGPDGWESPRSHVGRVSVGADDGSPHIAAGKPPARATAGQDCRVRVVITGDHDVMEAFILYRVAGCEDWSAVPLNHTFRNGYAGAIPGEMLDPGIWEFCVLAVDTQDHVDVWPTATGPGLPWTLAVLPE